jgi:hypothetical protein
MTPKDLARAKLAARRRRTSRIRNAVTAIAMAMFIAVFSVIYVQMASGNDPALGSSVSNQKVAIAKAASSSSTTSTSTTTDSTASASPASPAPMTTQQS